MNFWLWLTKPAVARVVQGTDTGPSYSTKKGKCETSIPRTKMKILVI